MLFESLVSFLGMLLVNIRFSCKSVFCWLQMSGADPGGGSRGSGPPPPWSKEEKKKKKGKEKREGKKEKNVQLYQRQTFCWSEVNGVDRGGEGKEF